MMMDGDQLEGCFQLLRAYFPGDWDEARCLVWAEAFQDITFDHCRNALVAMGRTAKYPTVAAFLECRDAPDADPRGRFMTGTGWVKPYELATGSDRPADRDAVVLSLADMRRQLRGETA